MMIIRFRTMNMTCEVLYFRQAVEKCSAIADNRCEWAIYWISRYFDHELRNLFIYSFRKNMNPVTSQSVWNYNLDAMPPAATIVSPVMYAASSEARNATIPATSSGSPNLNGKNEITFEPSRLSIKNQHTVSLALGQANGLSLLPFRTTAIRISFWSRQVLCSWREYCQQPALGSGLLSDQRGQFYSRNMLRSSW